MQSKINLFNQRKISYERLFEIFRGWNAYASWASTSKLIDKLIKQIKPNNP